MAIRAIWSAGASTTTATDLARPCAWSARRRGFDLDMAGARPMKDESDVIGAGGKCRRHRLGRRQPQIFTSVDIGVSLWRDHEA